ncbi:acyl-CoA dehydrogenase family protein [Halomarina halobia]|uniref:Acyl-CoA dehydrogenase family protein n=1 Tax=Halomarina halobia TaxID=3033386 RepID=A0ABD6AFT9_9EURY|nr:acyl-CoA dehydrogenase family protein [Halomarina sp. PSR21]
MTVELTEAQRNVRARARAFGEEHIEPVAMSYVESGEWPWDVYERAAEAGLIGLPFEAEYGGQEASLVEQCLVAEEFCRADSSVGIALHGSMTGCFVLSSFGTHEQKRRWLEPVTRGEITTGIGLTEPDTGSALSQLSTTAVRDSAEEASADPREADASRDGDEWVINGEKDWIANGASGDWVATLCRTDPDVDPEKPHRGLSLIVVPTDADGYEAEPRDRLGLDAAEHARISYDDVRVPAENLLGEEGQGFYQTLAWLEHGRVDIAAAHLGMAEGAYDRALAYSKEREQGGRVIGDYQGMRWKLADMRTSCQVAKSQVYHAARLVDAAERDGVDVEESLIEQASIAKLFATEMACDVAEEAVQVFGGKGFARENEVEHFYRDVKAGTIYEGTSEVQRNTIGKVLYDEL